MSIIMFFGLDGAGKTTLATALAEDLSRHGLKVKVMWMRGTHTISSILANLLAMTTTFKGSDNPYYGISIPQRMRAIWQLIEFASIIPIVVIKLILPSLLGSIVIAERSPLDFIVWVSMVARNPNYLNTIEAKFLLSLNAQVKVYVTCCVEEIVRRRPHNNHTSLKRQVELYDELASMTEAFRLDTTRKSIEESFEELCALLDARYSHRILEGN